MEFAVRLKDESPDKARWVLAVDPAFARLLMANDDGSMEWVEMADCTFVKAATPDKPTLVIPVPVKQGKKLAVPRLVTGNHG